MHVSVLVEACREIRKRNRLEWVKGKPSGGTKKKTGSPRKTSRANTSVSVPQTNTGGWDENSKVDERTLVKELGKTAVVRSQ